MSEVVNSFLKLKVQVAYNGDDGDILSEIKISFQLIQIFPNRLKGPTYKSPAVT